MSGVTGSRGEMMQVTPDVARDQRELSVFFLVFSSAKEECHFWKLPFHLKGIHKIDGLLNSCTFLITLVITFHSAKPRPHTITQWS